MNDISPAIKALAEICEERKIPIYELVYSFRKAALVTEAMIEGTNRVLAILEKTLKESNEKD